MPLLVGGFYLTSIINPIKYFYNENTIHQDQRDKFYFSDKEMTICHREDGPAVEHINGNKFWHINGKLHREDGPACEHKDGSKFWYVNGKRHREDGPAIERSIGSKYWYLDGEELTEAEFNARKAPCNGKKVVIDGIEYTLTIK